MVAVVAGLFVSVILLTFFSGYTAFTETVWVYFFQQIAFRKKEEQEEQVMLAETEIPNPEAVA